MFLRKVVRLPNFLFESKGGRPKCCSSMSNAFEQTKHPESNMDVVEINKSIMEINFKKEKLQAQIDAMNSHIQHLVAQREWLQKGQYETPLFDELFGG